MRKLRVRLAPGGLPRLRSRQRHHRQQQRRLWRLLLQRRQAKTSGHAASPKHGLVLKRRSRLAAGSLPQRRLRPQRRQRLHQRPRLPKPHRLRLRVATTGLHASQPLARERSRREKAEALRHQRRHNGPQQKKRPDRNGWKPPALALVVQPRQRRRLRQPQRQPRQQPELPRRPRLLRGQCRRAPVNGGRQQEVLPASSPPGRTRWRWQNAN